jgi:hypothetical protein
LACVFANSRYCSVAHVPGCVFNRAQNLDWKLSRIFMFHVEVIPHSCIPSVQIGLSIALCMRILLSFDFRPSYQYSLVSVIPSCFRFANMSAPVKSPFEVRDTITLRSRKPARYLAFCCFCANFRGTEAHGSFPHRTSGFEVTASRQLSCHLCPLACEQ